MAGLAATLGLGGYALATEGAFAITQRVDPSMGSLLRNRYIAGGVFTAAGLALAAFSSPVLGAGLAAGGLAALAGTQLTLALGSVLDKKPSGQAVAGLFNPGGDQRFAGVFGTDGKQQFSGVFGLDGKQQFSGIAGQMFEPDPWDGMNG